MGMNVKSGVTVKAAVVAGRAVWDGAYSAIEHLPLLNDSQRQDLATKIELAVISQLSQVLDFYGGGDDDHD